MNFEDLRVALKKHVDEMMETYGLLYEVDLDKDSLWNTYLDVIPPEHNKIYKSRREYDCSTCRHFVKGIGNVVAIKKDYDGKFVIETVWDFTTPDERWNNVVKFFFFFFSAGCIRRERERNRVETHERHNYREAYGSRHKRRFR